MNTQFAELINPFHAQGLVLKLRIISLISILTFFCTVCLAQNSIFFTGVDDLHYYNKNGIVEMEEDSTGAIIHFSSAITPSDIFALINAFPGLEILEGGQDVTIVSDESLEEILSDTSQFIADFNLMDLGVDNVAPGYVMGGTTGYVNDEIIIHVADDITFNDLTPRYSRFGGTVEDSLTDEILLIRLDSIEGQLELIQELYELGYIEWGQPNFHVEICSADIDPLFKNQYQLHNVGQIVGRQNIISDVDIDALEAWKITKGDRAIKVAVMDDGLEPHEDLTRVMPGYNPTTLGDGDPEDFDSYHGQSCAGLIAADHNDIGIRGIAPEVSLTGINISSCGVTVGQIAKGFLWARDNDIDIISNSWGFQQRDSNGRIVGSVCSQDLHPVITDAIIETAHNGRSGKGCVIVFSAGNSYSQNSENYCVTYPGNMDEVISVGAVNPSNGQRSAYSCYGAHLDVCAPSSSLLDFWVTTHDRMDEFGTSLTNYKSDFGGTSAAAPLVSGVAALILSLNSNLTREQVTQIIQQTAKDMGPPGFDFEFGHGMVNAYDALLETLPRNEEYLSSFDCIGNSLLVEEFEDLGQQNNPYTQIISSTVLSNGNHKSYWYNILNSDNKYESSVFGASSFSNLKLSFDFIAYGASFGDTFELQLSTDNGETYKTVNTFTYSHDFLNSNQYDYSTTLEGSFGDNTLVRVIAQSGHNNASIFLDNIQVGSCLN